MDGLQSLLNFMSIDVLLPEKFDDPSLFDFLRIDIMDIGNTDKRRMPAKASRLSSMT
jgi:hypothetical protein